ncbi:hypothetical protein C8F04DRAFT_1176438 [Mycena alexandri]|uniref:Uncharacterized protein n=1 Tax=Mycena alexandri TaxID=1745969 RepID=A0AAD6TC36_9AGAR|nr:hypothetical protein C8F04DRAFT_1176438 [Mycena alexandri]
MSLGDGLQEGFATLCTCIRDSDLSTRDWRVAPMMSCRIDSKEQVASSRMRTPDQWIKLGSLKILEDLQESMCFRDFPFPLIPSDALDPCAACNHPWLSHLAPPSSSSADPYRKGVCIQTSYGGFWPRSQIDPLTFSTPCVCNAPWFHHEALGETLASVSLGPPVPPPPAPPLPRVPPPLNPLQASLPPPVSTFTGPLSSGAATANENRNAAIARHFPPKPKKYKPPHAYPLAASSSPPFSVLVALWPNVIPGSTADDGDATIEFAFTIDQFTEMLLMLKTHGLAFLATLPSGDQGDIVQELSSQLDAQLTAHNLVLPMAPGSSNDSGTLWFRRPWIVLDSSRRKNVYTFAQHAKANANNFNKKLILEMNAKFVNPDVEHRRIPLVNLGVRYGPVKGALPRTLSGAALVDAAALDDLHSCLGQRLLYDLPHSGREYDPQCLGVLCPNESLPPAIPQQSPFVIPLVVRRERTPEAMVASSSRAQIRARSPESPSPVRTRRRMESPVGCSLTVSSDSLADRFHTQFIEVLSSDDDEFVPQPLLPPRRIALPRAVRAPAPPPSPPAQITLATGDSIQAWQRSIWLDVPTVLDTAIVRIEGHNISAMAEYIIAVFLHLRRKVLDLTSSFRCPPNIHDPRVDMTHCSFLQAEPYRSYTVRHTVGSVGRGVEHAVWRTILESVVNNEQLWRPSTVEPEHTTFVLSPISSPHRDAQFYVHAQLIAIHMYYGHGLSIGLWPVLAMALGHQSMLLGQAFVQLVSPSLAVELRPWFALHPEDPMPTALTHPACRLVMETLDIQPSLIPSVRTKVQHDDITVKLMAHKVFGYDTDTLWTDTDFVAAYTGFNMPLSESHGFSHLCRKNSLVGVLLSLPPLNIPPSLQLNVSDTSRRAESSDRMSTNAEAQDDPDMPELESISSDEDLSDSDDLAPILRRPQSLPEGLSALGMMHCDFRDFNQNDARRMFVVYPLVGVSRSR